VAVIYMQPFGKLALMRGAYCAASSLLSEKVVVLLKRKAVVVSKLPICSVSRVFGVFARPILFLVLLVSL